MGQNGVSSNHGTKNGNPTVRDIASIVFRHKLLIILTFVSVTLASGAFALLQSDQYQAEMKILVRQDRVDPIVSSDPDSSQRKAEVSVEEIHSEVELLKSRDLLEKVVLANDLQHVTNTSFWAKLAWGGSVSANSQAQAPVTVPLPLAVNNLQGSLDILPLPNTNLIQILYTSTDAALSAKVLQTLSDNYMQKHLAVHRPAGTLGFFEGESEKSREALSQAQLALVQFTRQRGTVAADTEKQAVLEKLASFESEGRELQASIEETRQEISSMESQLGTAPTQSPEESTTKENVRLTELRSKLLDLQLQRTQMAQKYQPTYRAVTDLDEQIQLVQTELQQEEKRVVTETTTKTDPVYEWLKTELPKARARFAAQESRQAELTRIVAEYRAQAQQLQKAEVEQQDLAREAKLAETNYLLYRQKGEEARIDDALDNQRILNVAVAEAPTVPFVPSNTRASIILLLGVFLAGFTSFGLAFVAEYTSSTVRTPDEVERYVGIPVLASIPKLSQ